MDADFPPFMSFGMVKGKRETFLDRYLVAREEAGGGRRGFYLQNQTYVAVSELQLQLQITDYRVQVRVRGTRYKYKYKVTFYILLAP